MPIKIENAADVEKIAHIDAKKPHLELLTAEELVSKNLPEPRMRIEKTLPAAGAITMIGKSKSGKSVLGVQMAIAIGNKRPLMECYEVLEPGPVLVIEQDDPAGDASVQAILKRSPIKPKNFHFAPRMPVAFGLEFVELLETQILRLGLKFVLLDSYTAMRPRRSSRADIVKAEELDLKQLDQLGKRTGSTIAVIHHVSHGSAVRGWSEQAGGTYAMYSAVEGQIHISRFPNMDGSHERLVHVRMRHGEDVAMVVRFREKTLDYEQILEGPAADEYPLLLQIQSIFGEQVFSPQELYHRIGDSRATVHRKLECLCRGRALVRKGRGEYALAPGVCR